VNLTQNSFEFAQQIESNNTNFDQYRANSSGYHGRGRRGKGGHSRGFGRNDNVQCQVCF